MGAELVSVAALLWEVPELLPEEEEEEDDPLPEEDVLPDSCEGDGAPPQAERTALNKSADSEYEIFRKFRIRI